MSRQYEKKTTSGTLTGGVKTVVSLDCPPRCQLQKLIVRQTAGTLVTFTVDLFSSLAAATAFAAATDDLNHVVAQITSDSAGKLQKFFDISSTGAYENQDGGPSNKLYKIYAVIAPAGIATNLVFDFTVGVLLEPDC